MDLRNSYKYINMKDYIECTEVILNLYKLWIYIVYAWNYIDTRTTKVVQITNLQFLLDILQT